MEILKAMNCLILCGGKATRLLGVNGERPKCLVKINDRSLLANLIVGMNPKFSRFAISYHENKQLIVDTLRGELEDEIFSKIDFFQDVRQAGTAVATLDFAKVTKGEIAVLNGDTMYSNFDFILPENMANNAAVICTSKQPVNRSGVLTYCNETGLVKYKKNRYSSSKNIDDVNNGIILLGRDFFDSIENPSNVESGSLEGLLLDRQTASQLHLKTIKLKTRFLDFGDPDTYENATARFNEFNDATIVD